MIVNILPEGVNLNCLAMPGRIARKHGLRLFHALAFGPVKRYYFEGSKHWQMVSPYFFPKYQQSQSVPLASSVPGIPVLFHVVYRTRYSNWTPFNDTILMCASLPEAALRAESERPIHVVSSQLTVSIFNPSVIPRFDKEAQ